MRNFFYIHIYSTWNIKAPEQTRKQTLLIIFYHMYSESIEAKNSLNFHMQYLQRIYNQDSKRYSKYEIINHEKEYFSNWR